jgi:PAS domain S-box-containing protein
VPTDVDAAAVVPPVPPLPPDEDERLAAVRALALVGTPPEERFDRITRLAAQVFDVPIVLVNLVDADELWMKSCVGLGGGPHPREDSFCTWAILDAAGMVVHDATRDRRFAANPAVTGPPHVRAYAGHPVGYRGRRVGTLCVVDTRPRDWRRHELRLLADLSGWVERELAAADLERATAELAASERRLHALLRSLPDAVVCFDRAGTVLTFNPAAESLFRRRAAEVVGGPIADLVTAPYRDTVAAGLAWRAGLDEGVMYQAEVDAACAEGAAVPIDVLVGELEGREGEVFVAVARDITARREVERMKDDFVAVVSHELRTPLTSIRASLALLATGRLGDLDPAAERMVRIAATNSERLVRLVNDVLDLDRLRTGRMPLAMTTVDVAGVCRTAVDGVAGRAAEAGVALCLEPPSAPVLADPDRMVQVLTNLLGNAITFSPPGGTVAVAGSASGEEVELCVADEGRGIPEADLRTIFAPFVQVDASDAREKAGTGLGLAIAREIVEAHGGHIWAESPEGGGARFHVTLPTADGGPAGEAP